jgi:hypothetical protein
MKIFSFPISSSISKFAPSWVPKIAPPFKTNFILDVPLASVPAVEMCWLISEAGIMIYNDDVNRDIAFIKNKN